ncbi:MAG: hypothetical protein IPJ68_02635 [Candidatus Moraniibacteriota bacterium]|nr:MAG: hypothetical protein IPJ68_02635 [Candidatus Moranbacteria bacterium]
MSDQAISYLRENKERYAKEALISVLRTSGYSEEDIVASARVVYGVVPTVNAPQTSVVSDFLIGFIVPLLFLIFLPFLTVVLDIFFIVYFWKRRRYIPYGVFTRWVFMVLFAGSILRYMTPRFL